jgi:4-amino-4-deoxy-L-arabinose transferase-like glycosyltransferase
MKQRSLWRYLWFTLLLIALTVGLLLLPRPLNTISFIVTSVLALVVSLLRPSSKLKLKLSWPVHMAKPVQRWLRYTLVCASSICILHAAPLLAPNDGHYALTAARNGLAWAFVAAVLLWGALLLHPRADQFREGHHALADARAPRRIAYVPLIVGIALLIFVLCINVYDPDNAAALSHHIQFWAFVAGVISVTWALAGLRWRGWRRHLRPTRRILPVVLLTLLAFFVRVYMLYEGLPHLIDEVHFMRAVGAMLHDGHKAILTPHSGTAAFTWLYPYMQTVSSQIFGPGLFALRLPSVVFGTVQVVAVYYLARALFNRPTADIAAVLLATLPVHIQFSRIGLNNIIDPTFGVLAFLFLVYGLRNRSQANFVLAGAFLGLTHYFYEGGRLFYTMLMLAYLIWVSLALPRKQFHWPGARNFVLFGLTFAIIVMPLYATWLMRDLSLFPRYSLHGSSVIDVLENVFTAPDPLRAALEKLEVAFYVYFHWPLRDGYYNADVAFILPALIAPFFLGLAHCVARLRHAGAVLMLGWVMTGTLVGWLVDAISPRYVVVFPAMVIVTAIGLQYTWQLLAPLTKRWPMMRWGYVVLVASLVTSSFWFYQHTFLPMLDVYNAARTVDRGVQVRDFDDAMLRIVGLPPKTDAHIISPGLWDLHRLGPFLLYFGRHEPGDINFYVMYAHELKADYLRDLGRQRNQAFFVDPTDSATIALLGKYFTLPEPIMSPHDVIRKERQLAMYFLPSKPP